MCCVEGNSLRLFLHDLTVPPSIGIASVLTSRRFPSCDGNSLTRLRLLLHHWVIGVLQSPRSDADPSWAGRGAELKRGNFVVLFVVPLAPKQPDFAPSRPIEAAKRESERSAVQSSIYRERLEARVGIEPTHKGFADLSLTTWVPRPTIKASSYGRNKSSHELSIITDRSVARCRKVAA